MQILERQAQLAQLSATHAQVQAGPDGVCVIVSGEAGIGKTTLLQAFVQSLPVGAPVLFSGCESLFTARPFGPLVDLAERFSPSVTLALRQGQTYNGLFPELLRFFQSAGQPWVFVVEDVHWADAGTLDVLRYLGRRLRGLPLLLLLTHRDENLSEDHPLQVALGEMPSATTMRLALPPLTAAAVDQLARSVQRDGSAVYAATQGNPFYVTELLAAEDGWVPASVREAVRSTLARLPPPARALAEWVSLLPGRAERKLLERVAAPGAAEIDACLRSGLLLQIDDALAYRHELARDAVYQGLPAHRRTSGHRAIYEALSEVQGAMLEAARCVHHAEAAGLLERVAELAPLAARQAAASGAHREAARLYGIALQRKQGLEPAARADLLEAQAYACMLTNQQRVAIAAREQACEIGRVLGDRLRQGSNLRWLARLHWFENGSGPKTFKLAQQAIAMLSALPPHRELALAYSTLSHLHLVGEDMAGAQLWGLRAIELAEALDDAEALCHALNNVGSARLRLNDDGAAWGRLARSLEIALEHGLEQDAARAYNNLFIMCVMHHEFTLGLRYAAEGIAYCEAHGLDVFTVRIRIRRAFAYTVMGQWGQADLDLTNVAERHTPSPMETSTHEFVANFLALRRGVGDAARRLAVAVQAMEAARVEIWFISTAAALAEVAWLEGRTSHVDAIARPALTHLAGLGDRWRSGELAAWLLRAGVDVDIALPELPRPYALECRGDWRAAADEWNRLGCPYNRALALCAGDEEGLREALVVFEALGALPASEWVRRRLRECGAAGVPRGPQPRTRGDPLGLTARERQVFELARQGLMASEIARLLRRSERTVEHHVAAIYGKLGVSSRAELVARHPPLAAKK